MYNVLCIMFIYKVLHIRLCNFDKVQLSHTVKNFESYRYITTDISIKEYLH